MRFLLFIVGVLTWQASCINGKPGQQNRNDEPNNLNDQALTAVTSSANQFAFKLFERVSRDISGNAVLAPSEYYFSQWATSYGKPQNTLDKLNKIFPLRTIDHDSVERGLRDLIIQISLYNSNDLRWDNKLYYRAGFEPTTNFKNAMWRAFYIQAEPLDFHAQTEASKVINEWFAITMNNHVPNIVEPADLTDDTSLALVNAIYFKGKWAGPFSSIPNHVFHVTNSKDIFIPFMEQLGFFNYGELPDVNAKFVGIKYEPVKDSEDGMSMFVILPNAVDGLAELEKNMKKISLPQLLNGGLTEMVLKMPKFSIKNRIVSSQPFEDGQMTYAFGDATHSTGQTNVPRQKSLAFIHKVAIDVDATSASNSINASPLPGTPNFIVDRPFICIVASTGKNPTVLLTARYMASEHWTQN